MARARNIKPGFFKNEVLVELPFEFRLLFIGLWTLADREGRLEDRPKRIKMDVFPADNVEVEDGLQFLARDGFIERYEVNGNKYIQVSAWDKHQTPHVKEQASTIPARCKHGANPSDSLIPDSLIPDSLIPDSLIPSISTSNDVLVRTDGPDHDQDETEVSTRATDEAQPVKPSRRKEGAAPCPTQNIIDLYHRLLPELKEVRVLSASNAGHVRQLWRTHLKSLEEWESFFSYIRKSDFLMGRTASRGRDPFVPTLVWLVKPENFANIANRKYHS